MAVKVVNTENIRKSKRWNERDDAALVLLLKKKIREMDISIRESDTPYERSRLKETKRHYKEMLRKVETGVYNGDIIFAELQAAAALRGEQQGKMEFFSKAGNGRKYVNSYMDMDFDYESAFRRTRYFGFALPFFMLLFAAIFIFVFVAGFLPASVKETAVEYGFNPHAMFTYKLSDTFDIEVPNDGNWPTGTWENEAPERKEYKDLHGQTPDTVKLYGDLGMTSIDVTAFDIIKAWFRTPMLEKTRLDFIEDVSYFQGSSYYYLCFLSGDKMDDLVIKKDADGNFDFSVIIRHIGTYGTIMFILVAFILGVINLISIIIRMFTYTTRKCHVLDILCFVFSLLLFLCPALASIEGTEIGAAFSNYFMSLTDIDGFLASPDTTVGIGILTLIPAACSLLNIILPKIFRNKLKKRVTFVPRGNKRRPAENDPYLANEDVLKHLV
ncbi:MAG TPA: hypothetical protein PKY53_03295 [Clostridia bacterium]|jgi:hypothetical protein|nr:hypothetical protein [Clostridia bacterium]